MKVLNESLSIQYSEFQNSNIPLYDKAKAMSGFSSIVYGLGEWFQKNEKRLIVYKIGCICSYIVTACSQKSRKRRMLVQTRRCW